MKLNELKNKSVLILGAAREGENTYRFLRSLFPRKELLIADRRKPETFERKFIDAVLSDQYTKSFFGDDYLQSLKFCDLVIKTPGISPYRPEIVKARKAGVLFTSQTDIFFSHCRRKIIGVTGTKGKSTAASLIHHLLSQSGIKSKLIGNIGEPVLNYLNKSGPDDYFVYELSSHQLLNLSQSPRVAVFLNIFPEHGDYYPSFAEYFKAKKNICLHQNPADVFIYNSSQSPLKTLAQQSAAKKFPFSLKGNKNDACFLKKNFLVWRQNNHDEEILSVHDSPLPGTFNLQNIMPAIIVGKRLGLPTQKISAAVKSFSPLEHRLEKAGTFKGITYYNDSIATVPESTIAAIESFDENLQTLIAGGYERNQNFGKLARKIVEKRIGCLILFPETGARILREVRKINKGKGLKHFSVNDMKEAVLLAGKHTPKGKICLLSPASPSFNLFEDYRQRGDLFKKYARELSV